MDASGALQYSELGAETRLEQGAQCLDLQPGYQNANGLVRVLPYGPTTQTSAGGVSWIPAYPFTLLEKT